MCTPVLYTRVFRPYNTTLRTKTKMAYLATRKRKTKFRMSIPSKAALSHRTTVTAVTCSCHATTPTHRYSNGPHSQQIKHLTGEDDRMYDLFSYAYTRIRIPPLPSSQRQETTSYWPIFELRWRSFSPILRKCTSKIPTWTPPAMAKAEWRCTLAIRPSASETEIKAQIIPSCDHWHRALQQNSDVGNDRIRKLTTWLQHWSGDVGSDQQLDPIRLWNSLCRVSTAYCSSFRTIHLLQLEGPGIESRWGRDFPHLSRPAPRPTQPPVQWVPGLSRGKGGRDVVLTTHPPLVCQGSRKRVMLYLCSP